MIKIGINTDNWRHEDKPLDYCFEVIAKQGVEYCELEAVGGTEFFTGLGFAPFVDLNSDPLELRKELERLMGEHCVGKSREETILNAERLASALHHIRDANHL